MQADSADSTGGSTVSTPSTISRVKGTLRPDDPVRLMRWREQGMEGNDDASITVADDDFDELAESDLLLSEDDADLGRRTLGRGRNRSDEATPPPAPPSGGVPRVPPPVPREASGSFATVNADQGPTKNLKKPDAGIEPPPAKDVRAAGSPPAPTFVAASTSAPAPPSQPADELSAIMQDILTEESGKSSAPVDDGAPRISREGWYGEVFDELFLRTLPSNTPHRTRVEADFLVNALALSSGSAVLDIACGQGRHAIELAERGCDVTGVDLSRVFLERALADAERRGVEPRLMVGDMRDIDFDARFDAAFCLGTSFGYFDDRTNFEVVTALFRSLKPGGRLAIETANRDYVVQHVPRRRWWDIAELIVMEEVDFDPRTSRLLNKRTLVDSGQRPWEQHISVRLYAAHELCSMLAMAGFRLLSLSGDIAHPGKFFADLNRSVIVTAQRPL